MNKMRRILLFFITIAICVDSKTASAKVARNHASFEKKEPRHWLFEESPSTAIHSEKDSTNSITAPETPEKDSSLKMKRSPIDRNDSPINQNLEQIDAENASSHHWPLEESLSMVVRSKRDSNNSLSNVVDQLELLVHLTNALILTEAVQSQTIRVGAIVTDFLIVEQLPKEHGWISELETKGVDPDVMQNISKWFEELEPLQDIIEKGEQLLFNADVITKSLSVLKGVDSTIFFLESAKVHEQMVNDYGDAHPPIFMKGNEKNMIELFKSCSELSKLQEMKFNASIVNIIPRIANYSLEILNRESSSVLEKARTDCNQTNINVTIACVESLKSLVRNLPLVQVTSDEITSITQLLKVQLLDTNSVFDLTTNMEKLVKLADKLNSVKKQNDKFASQKQAAVLTMVKDLNSLKDSSTALETMRSLLELLKPASSIVSTVNGILNGSEQSTSNNVVTINRLSLYSGFSNGIISMEKLAEKIDTSVIQNEIVHSGINARSAIIQKWSKQLLPIPLNSNGLHIAHTLSDVLEKMNSTLAQLSADLSQKARNYNDILNQIPDVNTSMLNKIIEIIKASKDGQWLNSIDAFKKHLQIGHIGTSSSQQLPYIMSVLPEITALHSALKTSLGSAMSNENVTEKIVDANIKHIIEFLGNNSGGMGAIQKLEDSIRRAIFDQDAIAKMASIDFVFSIPPFNQVTISPEEISEYVNNIDNATDQMRTVVKNKHWISDFSESFSPISQLQDLENNNMTQGDIEATQNLLKSLTNAPKIDVDLKESESIALLSPGSPFGYDVLRNLSRGLLGYRNLVNGISSVSQLFADAKVFVAAYPDVKKELEEIMKGAEVINVAAEPYNSKALETLKNIESIISKLKGLEKWILSLKAESSLKVLNAKKIRIKKASSNESSNESDARLRGFISKLNGSTAAEIASLSSGFQTLSDALTHVNCQKNPESAKCFEEAHQKAKLISTMNNSTMELTSTKEPKSSDNTTVVIAVIALVALSGVSISLGLWFFFKKPKKYVVCEEKVKSTRSEAEKASTEVVKFKKQLKEKERKEKLLQEEVEKARKQLKEADEKLEQARKNQENDEEATKKNRQKAEIYEELKLKLEKNQKERNEANVKLFKAVQAKIEADKRREEAERHCEEQKKRITDQAKMLDDLKVELKNGEATGLKETLKVVERDIALNKVLTKFFRKHFLAYFRLYNRDHISTLYIVCSSSQFAKCDISSKIGLAEHSDFIRYSNRPLYVKNRVLLNEETNEVVKVHASHFNDRYIASQAPLCTEQSEYYFFKAIHENGVNQIVQLCVNDDRKEKMKANELETVGYNQSKGIGKSYDYKVEAKFIQMHDDHIQETELTITIDVYTKPTTFKVTHYLHNAWPDKKVPENGTDPIIRLIKRTDEVKEGKVLVHCMAGSGRTMTYIGIAEGIRLLEAQTPKDKKGFTTKDIVNKCREARYGAIQTLIQFCFLELTIARYCIAFMNNENEETADYEILLKAYEEQKEKIMQLHGKVQDGDEA